MTVRLLLLLPPPPTPTPTPPTPPPPLLPPLLLLLLPPLLPPLLLLLLPPPLLLLLPPPPPLLLLLLLLPPPLLLPLQSYTMSTRMVVFITSEHLIFFLRTAFDEAIVSCGSGGGGGQDGMSVAVLEQRHSFIVNRLFNNFLADNDGFVEQAEDVDLQIHAHSRDFTTHVRSHGGGFVPVQHPTCVGKSPVGTRSKAETRDLDGTASLKNPEHTRLVV